MLLQKAIAQDARHSVISNLDEYSKVLDQVENVLNQAEDELSKHEAGDFFGWHFWWILFIYVIFLAEQSEWWLCTDRFTIADIALTILLERLNALGLEKRFWANGKRPHIEKYYEKVKRRESYKQTVPTKTFFVKMVLSHSPVWLGVGVVALLSVIIGGVFVVKKFIL